MSADIIQQAFGFSEEDYAQNNSGILTDAQEQTLLGYRKQQGCAGRCAIISVSLSIAIVFGVFFVTSDRDSAGFRHALPYYIATCAAFMLIFALFAAIGQHRSRGVRNGTISTAEGEIRTWTKNYSHGTAFYAKLGGVRFQLHSKEQMDALNLHSFYRIHFISNPPVHVILSMQVIG